jgi:hypothetical protein
MLKIFAAAGLVSALALSGSAAVARTDSSGAPMADKTNTMAPKKPMMKHHSAHKKPMMKTKMHSAPMKDSGTPQKM